MTDWIKHDGGPQPVADDVWVHVVDPIEGSYQSTASGADWDDARSYFVINQHLIDAKQAEIDALKEELETWQSVFPHIIPDRLQGQEDLGKEFTAIWDANTNALHEAGESDISNLIDAARLEGIRLGLEAAAKEALLQSHSEPFDLKYIDAVWSCIRALDPETIAREAKPTA